MQIHFKTKEDAIAYLEQRNAELEEKICLKRVEWLEARNTRDMKAKKVESTSWWTNFWYSDCLDDYYEAAAFAASLRDTLSELVIQRTRNEEHIQKIMEAENAEGFTIEV